MVVYPQKSAVLAMRPNTDLRTGEPRAEVRRKASMRLRCTLRAQHAETDTVENSNQRNEDFDRYSDYFICDAQDMLF
jgi:hypothetical protein